ncbi:plancitoxin-1-like [Thunnus albacares]|uniref:plancitoxin-1-like n=1 Tax=Thunnus albacares TaxID=8236 RepID=UPI001CF69A85|nr:plancitoxin-1-like [Thunnus albacares]
MFTGVAMVQKNDTTGTTGTGVWLLHSTPKFPYKRDKNNFWPKSGARNAQIFICVTFNYDQFGHIGKHLQLINVYPFMSDIPSDFHKTLQVKNWDTKIHSTLKQRRVDPTLQPLKSSRGKDFYSIAKQVSADGKPEVGDLYVSISEELKSDVNVQSWGCQPDRDGSFCHLNKRKVQNILFVDIGWAKWDPGSDHSKWCVAVDQKKPWTCIADVNRSESQYERLGGALCINDEEVRNIFNVSAKYKEEC